MEKVIRDGKVAVIISGEYGAGWYTWNYHEELLFHPKLVQMIEEGKNEEITEEWVKEQLGFDDVYCGGAYDLSIKWIEEGTRFNVEESDGAEYIITEADLKIKA